MEIKIPVHSQRAAVRCRTRLGTPQNAGYTNGPLRAQSKEVFLSILRREASVNCRDMKVSAESTVFRELRWQRGVDKYSVLMAGVKSAAGAVFCFHYFRQQERTMNMEEQKKNMLSLIQPTNTPHLGNYLGAMQNWVKLQNDYNCFFGIADLHSITVRQDPVKLRNQIKESYALLIAAGLDPEKSTLFVQGHNPNHAELSWILSCYTQFGELSRMTQFKDKSAKHPDNINAGLFTYPVLMAADILLYQADLVPVGIDQKQHLELARNVAQRFNGIYGDVFTMPDGYITKTTAKVMSLQEPTKKMSKSDENPNASVWILDDKDTIIRKFKRAVTDSETVVCAREGKDGIINLMSIYSAVTNKSFEDIEREFDGRGYGDFKTAVGEAVADMLAPMQTEFKRVFADKGYLENCMKQGAEKAFRASRKTLQKVQKKVGFLTF